MIMRHKNELVNKQNGCDNNLIRVGQLNIMTRSY